MLSSKPREFIAALTVEQRLVGRIINADWSVGAKRTWPPRWFENVDWPTIPRLAWQYKVRPMTAAALREAGWPGVPADVRSTLEKAERNCSTKAMQQISLLRTIIAAAKAQALRVVVMKGIALSAHLYGDPFIRESFDIDLLVHPDDIQRLDGILLATGGRFLTEGAPLSPRQDAILSSFHHDKKFVHAASGLMVERHYRLDRNPYLIVTDFDELWKGRRQVQVADYTVAILGDADLAHYLGIHATRHAWERWKWIADLAVLYRGAGQEGLLRLRKRAETLRCRHLFNSWVLLVTATTAAILPAAITANAAGDGKARRLAASALRISSIAHTPQSLTGARYRLSAFAYHLSLGAGFKYKMFELRTAFHRDEDWYAWRFPDRLIPLYYLLRPLSFIYRRVFSFIPQMRKS